MAFYFAIGKLIAYQEPTGLTRIKTENNFLILYRNLKTRLSSVASVGSG